MATTETDPKKPTKFQDMLLELKTSNETLTVISNEVKALSSGMLISLNQEKVAAEGVDLSSVENFLSQIRNTLLSMAEDLAALYHVAGSMLEENREHYKIMTGEALQREENAREAKQENQPSSPNLAPPLAGDVDSKMGVMGLIAGLGIMVAGFVTGYVSQIVKTFKAVFSGLSKFLQIDKLIARIMSSAFIKKTLGQAETGIAAIKGFFSSVAKWFSELTSLSKDNAIAKTFRSIKAMKLNAVRALSKFFSPIVKLLELFGLGRATTGTGMFAKLGSMMGGIGRWGKMIAKIAPIFFSAGKLLGKLAWPITMVLAAIDTFKAAITQFKKTGDFSKTFQAALTGLAKSIIAAPLDILKDAIGWILGALGATDVEKWLKSFSFGDIIESFVSDIFKVGTDFFEVAIQSFIDAFSDVTKAIENGDLLGAAIETIRGLLKTLLAMPLDLVKNTIAGIAKSLFGADDFSNSLKKFSFRKMLGGTNVPTEAESESHSGSVFHRAALKTSSRNQLEDQKQKDENAAERQGSESGGSNPFDFMTDFHSELLKSYAAASGDASTGSMVEALTNSTEELNSDAQSSAAQAPVIQAPRAPNISNSSSSVTYNASTLPERTNVLLQPKLGGY